MSIVRYFAALTIVATANLAAASTQAAPTGAGHPAHPHAFSQVEAAKRAACEKVWAAQRVRHGTHQAFVAACVAKG